MLRFEEGRPRLGVRCQHLPANHRMEVRGGLLRERSEALLKKFFLSRRDTEVVVTGPTRNRLIA